MNLENKQELESNPSFFSDLIQFMRQSKKWWLAPLAIVILLLGGLIILANTSAAPFIYSLF